MHTSLGNTSPVWYISLYPQRAASNKVAQKVFVLDSIIKCRWQCDSPQCLCFFNWRENQWAIFLRGRTKRKKEAGIKINRTKKRNEKGKLKVPIKNEQPSHPVFPNGHAIIHGYINRVLLKKWPVSLPLHPPRSLYCPFSFPSLILSFSLSVLLFQSGPSKEDEFCSRVPRILRGYHQQELSSMVYIQRVHLV